jgi:hypothetical protein
MAGIATPLGKKKQLPPPVRIRSFTSDAQRGPVKPGASIEFAWELRGPFTAAKFTGPGGDVDVTGQGASVSGFSQVVPTDVPDSGKLTYTLAASGASGSPAKTIEVKVRAVAPILDFGKIVSGDVSVAKKPFIRWFNEDFFPGQHRKDHRLWPFRAGTSPNFPPFDVLDPQGEARFRDIFDRVADLDRKKFLTLNEFLAYFFIIYIETAGSLFPVQEQPRKPFTEPRGEDYFFEPRAGVKVTYQGILGNKLAGDQLRDDKDKRAVFGDIDLTAAEVAAWNSRTTYPHNPPHAGTEAAKRWDDVKKAAQLCDFFKYRGLGLNQITGRGIPNDLGRKGAFRAHVDPLLGPKFGVASDDMSEEELTQACQDPEIAAGAFSSFYERAILDTRPGGGNLTVRDLINSDPPDFRPIGILTNGAQSYADDLQARCTAALSAIRATLEAGGVTDPGGDDGTQTV